MTFWHEVDSNKFFPASYPEINPGFTVWKQIYVYSCKASNESRNVVETTTSRGELRWAHRRPRAA
jgi:hypothetical protein